MTLPNPEHLFEQAAQLAAPPTVGAPRQADLRRAVSAAYYGLFHAILADAADAIVGRSQRDSTLYALVYRGVKHTQLRKLCEDITKQKLSPRYRPYEPTGGFGTDLLTVASAVVELQEKRHSADYDPLYRLTTSDAELSLATSRAALEHWQRVPKARRKAFTLLLLFLTS